MYNEETLFERDFLKDLSENTEPYRFEMLNLIGDSTKYDSFQTISKRLDRMNFSLLKCFCDSNGEVCIWERKIHGIIWLTFIDNCKQCYSYAMFNYIQKNIKENRQNHPVLNSGIWKDLIWFGVIDVNEASETKLEFLKHTGNFLSLWKYTPFELTPEMPLIENYKCISFPFELSNFKLNYLKDNIPI
jgi:hypothetical protein